MSIKEILRLVLKVDKVDDLYKMRKILEDVKQTTSDRIPDVGEMVEFNYPDNTPLSKLNGEPHEVIDVDGSDGVVIKYNGTELSVGLDRIRQTPRSIQLIQEVGKVYEVGDLWEILPQMEEKKEIEEVKDRIAKRIETLRSKPPRRGDQVILDMPFGSPFRKLNRKVAKVLEAKAYDITVMVDGVKIGIEPERILQIVKED